MRKTIITIISIFTIILLGLGNTIVTAVTYNAIVTSDRGKAKSGETVNVGVTLSDIDVGEKGINVFSLELVYDTNVFEEVKVASENGWSDPTYNSSNGKILIDKTSGTKETAEILKISLKVKNNANFTETEIALKNMIGSNGTEDIKTEDRAVTIKKAADSENTDNTGISTGEKQPEQEPVNVSAITIDAKKYVMPIAIFLMSMNR